MDLSTLHAYRTGASECFQRERAVLSELLDALVTTPYQSAITLTEAFPFTHQWGSLYKALARGQIDRERVRQLVWEHAPKEMTQDRWVIGIDITPVLRPASRLLADRTLVHVCNTPTGAAPVQAGWDFVGAVLLPQEPSAAVFPLELCRIPSPHTHRQAAIQLIRDLAHRTGGQGCFVLDREFGNARFLHDLADGVADVLIRLRTNGKVYRAPPPKRPHQRGRPAKHGPLIQASKPETQQMPDESWEAADGQTAVVAWHTVHFATTPDLPFTLFRVTRRSAHQTRRDPRVSWFVWRGRTSLPLAQVPALYRRRYSQEHGHRFLKQTLHWAALRVQTPERFQRWTDLVLLAHAALVIARPLLPILRRPWESAARPATLAQVQRSLAPFWAQIMPLPVAPKTRGIAHGRPTGFHPLPKTSHPIIRKSPKHQPKNLSSPASSRAG